MAAMALFICSIAGLSILRSSLSKASLIALEALSSSVSADIRFGDWSLLICFKRSPGDIPESSRDLNTGTRNKEIRFAEVKDLDTTNWILDIVHVKGEDSYGMRRQVPIAPEIHQLILEYLLARQKWMADFSVNSPALFPSRESDDGFLAGNTIRQIKKVVEDDIGVSFELRQCRRTFGQRNLDRGLDIESASVLMGHSTTNTTERFYSRMKLEKAQDNLKNVWMANSRNGEQQK